MLSRQAQRNGGANPDSKAGEKQAHIHNMNMTSSSSYRNSKYSLLDRGSDRLGVPIALAVDAQNNLYVIDERSRTILVYDSAGKFRHALGALSGGESYFESPAGIAIDTTSGHIYVCDKHRHMIIVMDDRGRLIGKAGKRGGGDRPGDFRLPTQVAVAAGELFVLDVGNARVQIFDTALHFHRVINLAYADHHTGLAVDGQRQRLRQRPSSQPHSGLQPRKPPVVYVRSRHNQGRNLRPPHSPVGSRRLLPLPG